MLKKFSVYLGWGFLIFIVVLLIFSFTKKGIVSPKMGINLLVVGDNNIAVLIVRPQEGVTTWVNFPTDLKIKVWPLGATYPILSLWKYAQGEKKSFEITEKTLGLVAGVSLPRMVKLSNVVNDTGLLSGLLNVGLETDLSWKDRWEIRNYLSESIKSKRLIEVDAPQLIMDKVEDPDGKEFFVLNAGVFHWVKDKFYFETVLSEDAEVSVENLSGVPGMGTQMSRQLETAGMRVVEVKSGVTTGVTGGLECSFVTSKSYPNSERFLQEQVGCKKEKNNGSIQGNSIIVKVI